jgi:hypothetical protein
MPFDLIELNGDPRPHGAQRGRVEAQGLVVSLRALAALNQEQEPEHASGETVRREPEEHILGSVTVDAGVCEPKGAHQLR